MSQAERIHYLIKIGETFAGLTTIGGPVETDLAPEQAYSFKSIDDANRWAETALNADTAWEIAEYRFEGWNLVPVR